VESFIKSAGKQGTALKVAGTTLLIDCNDAQMAAMLAIARRPPVCACVPVIGMW
jgi:hypothetical protein